MPFTDELIKVFPAVRRQWNAMPQPEWMRSVQVGDVLECNRGKTQRVVRSVTFYRCGALHGVRFTIKHCSWTHRCETFLCYTDLIYRGFYPAGHRVKLNRLIDRKIARNIVDQNLRTLDCCDVKGIS